MVQIRCVIPTYRNPAILGLHLHCHYLFTPPEVELVVVAQSCGDEDAVATATAVAEQVNNYPLDVRIVSHHEDGPLPNYSAACNTGAFAVGEPDVIVFLNDDTLPGYDWVGWLRDEIKQSKQNTPRIGLVGMLSDYIAGQQYLTRSLVEQQKFAFLLNPDFVITAAAWADAKAFAEVGGFDERFVGQFSDNALSARFRAANYHIAVGRVYIRHLGHMSTRANEIDISEQMVDAEDLFHLHYTSEE